MSVVFNETFNPFDFTHPVSNRSVFAGRKKELDEVKYYLVHAARSDRAINLALIGERASGKSSLLNIIDAQARDFDFAVARVDLDDSLCNSEMRFFQVLFDAILHAVCEQGAFQGHTGATYGAYRDMVDAYEIPEDKAFWKFLFPVQYARSMQAGRSDAAVSASELRKDFAEIRKGFGKPIVLLLDECDVLAASKTHLQRIRNTFQNIPGFMLVMTGTPELFSTLASGFPSAMREFRKISVEPFRRFPDTVSCVLKPLEKVGLQHTSQAMEYVRYPELRKIHEVSGGRPYEIQMLCHFMFKHLQDGRAGLMELSYEVLEDVRDQLEDSGRSDARRIMSKLSGYDQRDLEALGLLCPCSGHASFDQVWFAEYTFQSDPQFSARELRARLIQFVDDGVLGDSGKITFLGDELDLIYSKALSKQRGVAHLVEKRKFDQYLVNRLDAYLISIEPRLTSSYIVETGNVGESGTNSVPDSVEELNWSGDPWVDEFPSAYMAYMSSISSIFADESSTFVIACATLRTPWLTVRSWYESDPQNRFTLDDLGSLSSRMSNCREKADQLGGEIEISIQECNVIPIETLVQSVERSQDDRLKSFLSLRHYDDLTISYLIDHDLQKCAVLVGLIDKYGVADHMLNNVGYIHLVLGNLVKARILFQRSIGDQDASLPSYNLGVLEAMEGNMEAAIELMDNAIALGETASESQRQCGCLLLINIEGTNQLSFPEVNRPNLLEAAKTSQATLRNIFRAYGTLDSDSNGGED